MSPLGDRLERMAVSWEAVVAHAAQLPEVEVSTSYGTPALKVAGKLFARLRSEAEGGLAVKCSAVDKEALVSGEDPAYFTISHYDGHNYILVHLEQAEHDELFELLEEAWRIAAPQRVRALHPD